MQGSAQAMPAAQSATRERPLALARWLLVIAALVIAIVAVGGITRLTESGVSITEWKPVSGAIPPLMGWVAARGELTRGGLALCAILAFWQLPHFMAIAWIYRDDYARAGFRMLPVLDPQGVRTSRQAIGFTLGLLPVSLGPFVYGLAGPMYLVSALVLGLILSGTPFGSPNT